MYLAYTLPLMLLYVSYNTTLPLDLAGEGGTKINLTSGTAACFSQRQPYIATHFSFLPRFSFAHSSLSRKKDVVAAHVCISSRFLWTDGHEVSIRRPKWPITVSRTRLCPFQTRHYTSLCNPVITFNAAIETFELPCL